MEFNDIVSEVQLKADNFHVKYEIAPNRVYIGSLVMKTFQDGISKGKNAAWQSCSCDKIFGIEVEETNCKRGITVALC